MLKSILCLLLLGLSSVCIGQNQLFLNYTKWKDLKVNANKENKQILLYFGATWCAPCKQLLNGVFADSSTQLFLKSKFQSYEFDFDNDNTMPFLKKYAISAVPWILILDNQGNLKASMPSIPQEIPAFKDEINKIAASDFFFKGINNELTLNYPEFYNQFYESRREKFPDSTAVTNYLKTQSNLFSEVNWNVLNLFNSDIAYFDFVLSNKEKYKELYGNQPVGLMLHHAYTIFFQKYTATRDSISFNRIIRKYLPGKDEPNYKNALESFYIKEIRFLAVTTMDWSKFMSKANTYIQAFGEKDNHFICSYAYNSPSSTDSVNQYLLQIMRPVLVQKPDADTYFMYGALLLKLKKPTEAELYFNKVLDSTTNQDSRTSYRKRIEEFKKQYSKV